MEPNVLSWGFYGFLIGIGCVFLVLLVLIVLITLMGKIVQGADNNKKKAPNKKAVKSETVEIQEDEDEIIAVITAAIACMAQREGKKFKIRSFKRV